MNQSVKAKVYFISGHFDITLAQWNEHYKSRIDSAMIEKARFVVGDSKGADTMSIEYLHACRYPDVTVYHVGKSPQRISPFPSKGKFLSHAEKDRAMTKDSDQDIAWVRPDDESRALYGASYNPRRISGTQQNINRRANSNQY
jgi:hypothetical protein